MVERGKSVRVAVIDTGTNSTRLLVAEVSGAEIDELERHTTITRLGEGVDEKGVLGGAAKDRVLECVAGYATTIAKYSPATTVVMATSSVRDARDGERFLAEVAGKHGFGYQLLSGQREAELSFRGAAIDLPHGEKTLLFDVGGGSTETVIGRGSKVVYAHSMRLGCVRLTERFFSGHPVPADELAAAAAFIDKIFEEELERAPFARVEHAVGVAGTVTSLAAIDLGLKTYDRNLVHGHEVRAATVSSLLRLFAGQKVEETMKVPTMEEGRADVMAAGTLIVERLLGFAGVDSFVASEHDILDGAALSLARGEL